MPTKPDHSRYWYKLIAPVIAVMSRGHDVHVFNEATRDIKPPFIALGNHQGYYDWCYAAKALAPHNLHIVMSRNVFHMPLLGYFVRKSGAIGKSQFAADAACVKNILRTVRRGESVLIYASGRISLFGEDVKPHAGIYPLLKKLGVPVVMVHVDGSYRTGPRYNPDIRKHGRVDVYTSVLFTPEELQALPEAEARRRLDDAFTHDDFDSPNQGEYTSANLIDGLADLLYLCPACKSDFTMKTEGTDIIKCTKCGFRATMDNRFRLKGENGECPGTISAWGRMIRAEEARRLEENPFFELRGEMKLCEHAKSTEQFSRVGTVEAVYNWDGFTLKGERLGQPYEKRVSCEEYHALHFVDKLYIIVPDNEREVCVSPPTAAEVTKWAVVSQEIAKRKGVKGNI